MYNVPDDWAFYYIKCVKCKNIYHLSENYCDRCCEEEEKEENEDN